MVRQWLRTCAEEAFDYNRSASWRGGRAVEGSCLENSRTMSTVGSNPTLSAEKKLITERKTERRASHARRSSSTWQQNSKLCQVLIVNACDANPLQQRQHRAPAVQTTDSPVRAATTSGRQPVEPVEVVVNGQFLDPLKARRLRVATEGRATHHRPGLR